MKGISKLFIICLVLMVSLTAVLFVSTAELGILGETGLAVPESASVLQSLRAGTDASEKLVKVDYEDTVYSTVAGYFVGAKRTPIDKAYPIYINSGATLRFLNEENWLLSADAELVRTYEGLYLSDGYTYNSNMTQADLDEFILLSLSNGLYMNAQDAVFKNRITSHEIPGNSIMFFNDKALRWYVREGESLVYGEEEAVFDATLTIGDHTYRYDELLKALGLFQEAIEKLEKNRNADDLLNELSDTLIRDAENRHDTYHVPGNGNNSDNNEKNNNRTDSDNNTNAQTSPSPNPVPSASPTAMPASSATPNPSATPATTPNATAKPSATPAHTATPSNTPTPTNTPGATNTPNPTTIPGATTAPTSTPAATGTPNPTNTPAATGTPNPTNTPGATGTPTPTNTPGATAVPDATGTPTPTNTPGATSTPAATGTPIPTNTPGATSTPGVTGTPTPTNTPAATNSPIPTGDPDATSTPKPTNTPAATNTPIPTNTPATTASPNPTHIPGTSASPDPTTVPGTTASPIPTDIPDIIDPDETPAATDDPNSDDDDDDDDAEAGTTVPDDISSDNDEEGDGENTNPGDDGKPRYKAPTVSLSNFKEWSYAIGANLKFSDPANTVLRGVKVTAYKSLNGGLFTNDYTTITDSNGNEYRVYSANKYTGKSAIQRKTLNSTQEFALTPLPPENEIYIQYTYKYYKPTGNMITVIEKQDVPALDETGNPVLDENGNPVMTKVEVEREEEEYVKTTYTSDFIRLETPSNEDVIPIEASWTEGFATQSSGISLDPLSLQNKDNFTVNSDNGFSFEELTKDTMAYVYRLDYTLTPINNPNAETVVVPANTTVISKAMQEGGTSFVSSGVKLASNTVYSYTVQAKDRYGNVINMNINDSDSGSLVNYKDFSGNFYTSKQDPTVTISEVENITDKLTVKVSINDPDGALAGGIGEGLRVKIKDQQSKPVLIGGKWANGTNLAPIDDGYTLLLTEPEDGKEYTIVIDSLAFARAYTIDVYGDYNLQPDAEDAPGSLEDVINELMGSLRTYTAALTNGNLQFTTSISNLLDTSVTFGVQMNGKSTTDILPMIDEFRFTLKESASGAQKANVVLALDDYDVYLGQTNREGNTFSYDAETKTVLLREGDTATGTPKIELYGNEEQFAGKTLWECILLSLNDQGEYDPRGRQPVTIRVSMPKDSLKTSTKYKATLESVVIKSGIEYKIPTSLTLSEFTTKKIQPVLTYDDFFIAGDIAQFIKVDVYDPDGTIDGELINVNLYCGDTLLSTEKLYASTEKNAAGNDIRFKDIIPGAEYTICFIAPGFNDAEGYASYVTNKTLYSFSFTGGSGLSGSLNLESLEYESMIINPEQYLLNITGPEMIERIDNKTWPKYSSSNDSYWTEYIDIPAGTTFIRIDTSLTRDVYFYKADKKATTNTGSDLSGYSNGSLHTARDIVLPVPKDAATFRIRLYYKASISTNDLKVSYYTTPRQNLIDFNDRINGYYQTAAAPAVSASYSLYNNENKIPVSPGDLLMAHYLYSVTLWSPDGGYVGTYSASANRAGMSIIVPDNVGYVSVCANNGYVTSKYVTLERVSRLADDDGYRAVVSVDVKDNEGYLAKKSDTPAAILDIYQSDTINSPVFTAVEGKTNMTVPLSQVGEAWVNNSQEILSKLDAGYSYKMTLSIDYQGNHVVLDEIVFNTDGIYYTITCQEDMINKVAHNPFANYICTQDFVWNKTITGMTLQGTIDFQGHVVTKTNNVGNLVSTIGRFGKIRNLVVDIDEGLTLTNYLFQNNYGILENLVVRTKGQLETLDLPAVVTCNNYGTIRNFIVKLGGDVYIRRTSNNPTGFFVYSNSTSGIIESGYMYSSAGSGIVYTRGNTPYYGGALLGYLNDGQIRNVFTSFDSWHPVESPGNNSYYTAALLQQGRGIVENVYHAGDFYRLNSDGSKSYAARLPSDFTIGRAMSDSRITNLWHLSATLYNTSMTQITRGLTSKLYDSVWQAQMLGDSFESERNIEMGFFPRLKFPADMQRHQEYLPLPLVDEAAAPRLVSDGWAEGYNRYNEKGVIKLRFQNEKALNVLDVNIDGILVKNILAQRMAADGLWDVILEVEATNYVSKYKVTNVTYASGSGSNTVITDYTTQNFEFWKEVRTYADWQSISTHMNWNYRLMNDLNFGDSHLTTAAIKVNGSTTNIAGTTTFTGKIDGGLYDVNGNMTGMCSLRNIHIENVAQPNVIYRLGGTGIIKNLIVENMKLSSTGTGSGCNTGFIGLSDRGCQMDNIHIVNSEITGYNYVGSLVGGISYGEIKNCSATGCTLRDMANGTALYMGGLVGRKDMGPILNCYVRDTHMYITQSPYIGAIGGITGYQYLNSIQNCYATGKMEGTVRYTGGITGAGDSFAILNCWTEIDIVAEGSNIGGISGVIASNHHANFAGGDIISSGTDIHRAFGYYSSTPGWSVYAYKGQKVADFEENDSQDVRRLFTGLELRKPGTWSDLMGMSSYDFEVTRAGFYPKVYNTDGTALVWGQEEGIIMPLESEEHTLVVDRAEFDERTQTYYASVTWTHPGIDTQDIKKAIELGFDKGKDYEIILDGMDITDTAIGAGEAKVSLESNGEPGQSNLLIECKNFIRAFDNYNLYVNYNTKQGRQELVAIVDYGEPLYLEIHNLEEWNEVMRNGHDKTNENFKIKGIVDFKNGDTNYVDLKVGRITGEDLGGGQTGGFANLYHMGGHDGVPWVETAKHFENLSFTSFKASFNENLSSAKYKSNTGFVHTIDYINDCVFDGVAMTINRYTAYVGFFSNVNQKIENVEIKNVNITSTEKASTINYIGPLAARISEDFENVKASNITVDAVTANYVGGVFGYFTNAGNKLLTSQGLYADNIHVKGNIYVGGLGYNMIFLKDVELTNFDVSANYHVGGIAYQFAAVTNGTVKDGSVLSRIIPTPNSTPDYRTGGMAATTSRSDTSSNLLLKNVDVKGGTHVGGIVAYATNYMDRVQVIGCTIQSREENPNTFVGGIVGRADYNYLNSHARKRYLTVRDTTIRGVNYVGGIAGRNSSNQIYYAFVGPDVTVTATDKYAGGIAGYSTILQYNSIACGAEVTAGSYAGGIVGRVNWLDNEVGTMSKVYFGGKVTATNNYAGGIVGCIRMSSPYQLDHFTGIAVAAEINSAGGKASAWVNNEALQPTTPGDGVFYIWDQTTVSGQNVKAQYLAEQAAGTEAMAVPKKGSLVTADQFRSTAMWTTLGYTTTYFDFEYLENYMPFVKNDTTSLVLDGSMTDKDGYLSGIPQPVAKEITPEKVSVYTSGVNSVNIEIADVTEPVSVTVNGSTFTTDSNGVLTLGYDFMTPLEIQTTSKSVQVNADTLRRKVMTYGNTWYYIDPVDKQVYYGTSYQNASKPYIEDLENVIHLWQGKALTENGTVYDLSATSGTPREDLNTSLLDPLASRSIYRTSYIVNSAEMTVNVFHNFTIYGGEKIEHRVFPFAGRNYTVSPYQGVVYDGVLLASYDNGISDNGALQYFAVLKEDGHIENYMMPWSSENFITTGISHISNNFGYLKPIVLAAYNDGRISGYDYANEEILFTVSAPMSVKSFMGYALNQMRSLTSSLMSGRMDSNAGFMSLMSTGVGLGETGIAQNGQEAGEGKDANPWTNDVNGGNSQSGSSDSTDGVQVEPGKLQAVKDALAEIGSGSGALTPSTGNGTANPVGGNGQAGMGPGGSSGIASAGNNVNDENNSGDIKTEVISDHVSSSANTSATSGTAMNIGSTAAEGTVSASGNADAKTEQTAEPETGENTEDSEPEETDEQQKEELTEKADSEEADNAEKTEAKVPDEGAYYVPGEGIYEDGKLVAEMSELSVDVEQMSISVGGEVGYYATFAEVPAGYSSDIVVLHTPVEHQKAVLSALGSTSLAYDPKTGEYTAVNTGDIFAKPLVTMLDGAAEAEELAAEEKNAGSDTLKITHGFGRTLSGEERSGFMLICVVGIAGIAILAYVYFRIVRRKTH